MDEMPRRRKGYAPGGDPLARAVVEAAADEAVRAAEQAVCDAWLAELIDADRSAADTVVRCHEATDAGHAALRAAQLAGDVGGIATAQAALEETIRDLKRGMAAYEAVHALLADQYVWSAEAAALRIEEAAMDERRIAAAKPGKTDNEREHHATGSAESARQRPARREC